MRSARLSNRETSLLIAASVIYFCVSFEPGLRDRFIDPISGRNPGRASVLIAGRNRLQREGGGL
jgi:hypothetical protein